MTLESGWMSRAITDAVVRRTIVLGLELAGSPLDAQDAAAVTVHQNRSHEEASATQ